MRRRLPCEGDPVGLGGPVAFNAAALEAGEAVVCPDAATGLVPLRVGPTYQWVAHEAGRRQLTDVGEADRGLRAALLESADLLARLEVARWRPEVADELLNLRQVSGLRPRRACLLAASTWPPARSRPSASPSWRSRTTAAP